MQRILKKRIPFIYAIIFIAFFCCLIYFAMKLNIANEKDQSLALAANVNSCNLNTVRLQGYPLVKPLMFVDSDCEGSDLFQIKEEINQLIGNYTSLQGVTSTAVYLRDFSSSEWISINENELYNPGSLFKVPVLMTYLKMNELSPGVLNKEISYTQRFTLNKEVAFKSKSIQLGNKYKVKELLKYMIEYSDNNATILLTSSLDNAIFIKLFTDFDMKAPIINAEQYQLSAQQYSYFMRAIYNASYLSVENSEYAAELLTKCDFKDGIMLGLPKGIQVAHKFGESGTSVDRQLHESAIVYLDGKSYLLTIMTKGKDIKVLSKLMGDISRLVYSNIASAS
jgi:beta-lactamase class A